MANNQWNPADQNPNEWNPTPQNSNEWNSTEPETRQWDANEQETQQWDTNDWNAPAAGDPSDPNSFASTEVFTSTAPAAGESSGPRKWPWITVAILAALGIIAAITFYLIRGNDTEADNTASAAASESVEATSEAETSSATETSEDEQPASSTQEATASTVTHTQTVTQTQQEDVPQEGVVIDGRYYYNTPESMDRPYFCDGRGVLIIASEFSYEAAQAVAAQNPGSEVLMPGECASLRQIYEGNYVYPVIIDYLDDITALCAAEAAGRGNARIMQDVADWTSPC